MKKHYLAALAVTAMLGLSGTAFAASGVFLDGAGIVGSPHDFTDNIKFGAADGIGEALDESQWNWRKEICRVCHSPHDKQREAYKSGLLWNRQLSAVTDYVPFALSEKAGNKTTIGQPTGRAKMCLSCHDNTVALGQFDNYADGLPNAETGTDGAKTFQQIYTDDHFMIGNHTTGGTTLAGTHPISVDYAAAINPMGYPAGKEALNPLTNTMGISGQIKDVLDGGKVQCSSCHDVHNRVSIPGTHLLRQSQKAGATGGNGLASGLCLTCHNK